MGWACLLSCLAGGGPVIVLDPYKPETLGLPQESCTVEGDTVIVSSITDSAHGNPRLVQG